MEKAYFGAGCFWGVQKSFDELPGVLETYVGYMGGNVDNPTYEQVCSDSTGHVEVIEIDFDPEKITYNDLLKRFFEIHDPTQLNRQGPDIGTQYRSVIFAISKDQKEKAKKYIEEINNDKIVTAVEDATVFYKAEEYHQKYLDKRNKNVCS